MSVIKHVLQGFNRGLVSPLALARTDLEKTALAAETMTNWLSRVLGSMILRPGSSFLGSSYADSAEKCIPFVFSTDDVALIEITASRMRVWISDAVVTRGTVSTTVTSGTFTALTGWTDADESGGTSELWAGRALKLTGNGTAAAIRRQLVTVSAADAGDEHALSVVVERGPVNFRIGSYINGDDYFTETELEEGAHSLAFTPSGDFYIQFKNVNKYSVLVDNCTIEAAGAMTVTAPWSATQLDMIRYDQSGDIIFTACTDLQQYKIERRTTRSWSVVKYFSSNGPFRDENLTTTTITPSATSGDITLTASQPIFHQVQHEGALFRITSEGQSVTSSIVAENTFTSTIKVTGVTANRVFTITRSGTWVATVTLQRSLTAADGPFEDVTTYTTNATITFDDALDNQIAWYRIGVKTGNYTSGTVVLTLGYAIGSVDGIVRIQRYAYDWISRTSSSDSAWQGIAWSPSLQLFAAVADSGANQVMTSPDGITWTNRAAASAVAWTAVTWSPALALFVAVARSGAAGVRVQTSPDGITWTSRTAASASDWYDITWASSLSLLVAVGINAVMTSPDGVTWTSRTPASGDTWVSVAWSPSLILFVAVASGGAGSRIMTSADGVTWTERTNSLSGFESVAWSPELSKFVAVGGSASAPTGYSSDGITWVVGSGAPVTSWQSVAWSPHLLIFTAVASSGFYGLDQAMTSNDGINWISRATVTANSWEAIAWSPELSIFAAVSETGTGNRVMTTYNNKTALATVLTELGDIVATDTWSEGKWSDYRGWPTVVAFSEGRLWWAGFNGVFGSVSDDYYNFNSETLGDSGPIDRTVGSGPVDSINWMLNLQRLVLGTEGNEIVCKSSSFDEPLTPTAFSLRTASTQGSGSVNAIAIDRTGVFVQRGGTRIYELAIDIRDGEYGSTDLTVLNPEICQPQITRIAVQRQPDTRIHCIRSDGKVAIMVYDRAENVRSWSLYETDGTVEDVVVLPGAAGESEDHVYYFVKRTINSATKRYLERWATEAQCEGATLSRNIDCFYSYSGASATVITGLSHLEAKSVVVWANGKDLGSYTVASGQITLTEAVTSAIIGLPYTAQWKSVKLAYSQGPTMLLRKKKINHLGVVLKNTHYQGLTFGPSFTVLDDLPQTEDNSITAADTIHSTYDEEMIEFPGEWDTDARLCLQAESPRPCNILAAIVGIESYDKN